jgi:hypothetical protein
MATITQRIQLRRDTAAAWASGNPTLQAGELGFETDTGKFKLGTGVVAWTSLAYASILPGTAAIVDADISASASIADTKLATITASGKVNGSAITSGDISTSGSFTTTSTVAAAGVTSTGQIRSSSASAGVGYATGAGSTVTQITSKASGVTIDTPVGQIVTHNAALAAAAEISFTVTNSSVAATDCIILNLASGGTANTYTLSVHAVASGSFDIMIGNVSTSSRSEALTINFTVIKGVVS